MPELTFSCPNGTAATTTDLPLDLQYPPPVGPPGPVDGDGAGPMTAATATGTLERNLEFLRLIGDGHLADMVEQLPESRRASAAAAVVRLEAPAGDTIVNASHAELPATVRQILTGENR
jgi:hypothetical protein